MWIVPGMLPAKDRNLGASTGFIFLYSIYFLVMAMVTVSLARKGFCIPFGPRVPLVGFMALHLIAALIFIAIWAAETNAGRSDHVEGLTGDDDGDVPLATAPNPAKVMR